VVALVNGGQSGGQTTVTGFIDLIAGWHPIIVESDLGPYWNALPTLTWNGTGPITAIADALLLHPAGPATMPIPGDANGDGQVNTTDLTLVQGHFGQRSTDAGWLVGCDLNGDNRVDAADLGLVTRDLR